MTGIVDRIGGGDAFAAGVLHHFRTGQGSAGAAHTGLALAVLKHSLHGNAALFRQAEIDAFSHGDSTSGGNDVGAASPAGRFR